MTISSVSTCRRTLNFFIASVNRIIFRAVAFFRLRIFFTQPIRKTWVQRNKAAVGRCNLLLSVIQTSTRHYCQVDFTFDVENVYLFSKLILHSVVL